MAEVARAGPTFRPIPARGLRVVHLTYDEWIDRRIVSEARSLIDAGFDAYVLAGSTDGEARFEHDDGVPIERVGPLRYAPLAERLLLRGMRKESTRPVARRLMRIYQTARRAAGRALDAAEGGLSLLRLRQPAALVPVLQFAGVELAYFRRARFYRPDIVHVHDLPLLRLGVAVREATGARLVYDMHEYYPELYALAGRAKRRARRLETRYVGRADARITVNRYLADIIAERYGVDVAVVQNAIRSPPGLHARRHDRFREELGVAADRTIFLYQGWIAPNRNLENAVAAMALVQRPIVLVIMGYGEFRGELERIARAEGVADRVVFVDAKGQDELLEYTASADVGLIPYARGLDLNTTYVSPNKLYEFIVARLPMLSNDLPFVREVVETNGFGVVADLQTPESAAAAIDGFPYDRLAWFRENLERMGHAWTWDAEQHRLLDVYDRMVGRFEPGSLPRDDVEVEAEHAIEGAEQALAVDEDATADRH